MLEPDSTSARWGSGVYDLTLMFDSGDIAGAPPAGV
jgi:hypothetical protein